MQYMYNNIKYLLTLAISIVLFLMISLIELQSFEQKSIDTVYYFKPGTGQNAGQSSECYPQNIFGLPDTNANESVPASSPLKLLSLGMDGEIIVGFKGYDIVDGEGDDFTIFENVFLNSLTHKLFVEPAIVSVSQDGVNFIDFPFDSLTLVGCAGTKPTLGANNPFDPSVSGGNSFNLSDVGLNRVSYIKIKDFCRYVYENHDHPFFDPTLSGFDLDAVLGLHLDAKNIDKVNNINIDNHLYDIHINNNTIFIKSGFSCSESIGEIYSITGELIAKTEFLQNANINVNLYQYQQILILIRNSYGVYKYKLINM